jgi:hypothetical protein
MASLTNAQTPIKTDPGDTEHLIKTMLRDCVELCARVAEQRAANGVAMAIRRLKPPATWP